MYTLPMVQDEERLSQLAFLVWRDGWCGGMVGVWDGWCEGWLV